MRYAKLRINDVDILHEEHGGLYFTADYNSGKDNEIGTIKIEIYNLTQEVSVGSNISLDFGRSGDNGRFGTYKVLRSHKSLEGFNKVTELICSEMDNKARATVSISLEGQIKTSKAISEICSQAGLSLIQLDLEKDKIFSNGFSCFGPAKDELKELAINTGTKLQIKGSEIYFYTNKQQGTMLSLGFKSGLLENPRFSEKLQLNKEVDRKAEDGDLQAPWQTGNENITAKSTNEWDWEVKFLADHSVKKGNMIEVHGSDTFNGVGKIVQLKMSMKDSWVMTALIKGV